MRLLVKLKRRNGVLIAAQEFNRRPWTAVSLLTEADPQTNHRRLTLRSDDDGAFTPPRMELFQVTVSAFEVDGFVLRRVERVETGGRIAAVVQELACKAMPELGGEGWLSPRAKEFSREFETLFG